MLEACSLLTRLRPTHAVLPTPWLQAELDSRKTRLHAVQATLRDALENRRLCRDAAVVAVRHAEDLRSQLVGCLERLAAGHEALGRMRVLMKPAVTCVVCMEPMRRVRWLQLAW